MHFADVAVFVICFVCWWSLVCIVCASGTMLNKKITSFLSLSLSLAWEIYTTAHRMSGLTGKVLCACSFFRSLDFQYKIRAKEEEMRQHFFSSSSPSLAQFLPISKFSLFCLWQRGTRANWTNAVIAVWLISMIALACYEVSDDVLNNTTNAFCRCKTYLLIGCILILVSWKEYIYIYVCVCMYDYL